MPRVVITATEQVNYRKVIEITAEAFAEYEAACERDEDDNWFHQWADLYLDPLNDIQDGSDYEDVECRVFAEAPPAQSET